MNDDIRSKYRCFPVFPEVVSSMRRKILFVAVLLLTGFLLNSSFPIHSETVTRSFSLGYFDLTASYPLQADPGAAVIISFTARAKKTVQLEDLLVQIYSYDEAGNFKLVFSGSLVSKQRMRKDDFFQKDVSLTLPADAPRSALVAVASERVKVATAAYYPTPYWWWYWNYSYPWWSYPFWIEAYPVASYSSEKADSTILPLTYVLSSTPEYLDLQGRYAELDAKYQRLTSEYSDLTARYGSLEREHQSTVSQNQQLEAEVNMLTYEVESGRMWMYLFALTTVIFAVAAFFIAFLTRRPPRFGQPAPTPPPSAPQPEPPRTRQRRKAARTEPPPEAEPSSSGSAPQS